jgi:hypothetical protein
MLPSNANSKSGLDNEAGEFDRRQLLLLTLAGLVGGAGAAACSSSSSSNSGGSNIPTGANTGSISYMLPNENGSAVSAKLSGALAGLALSGIAHIPGDESNPTSMSGTLGGTSFSINIVSSSSGYAISGTFGTKSIAGMVTSNYPHYDFSGTIGSDKVTGTATPGNKTPAGSGINSSASVNLNIS